MSDLAEVRLIPAGHDGRLSTPSGAELPVRVFERGGDALMLVVLVGEEGGLAPTDPATLEYTSTRGLVRLHGQASLEDRDLIRFSPAADPEVLQRREFVRVSAPQPVVLMDEREGVAIKTHAVDVSGGGMLVHGLEHVSEGKRLEFSLELDDGGPPVEGRARVVRELGEDQRGIVFEAISESDRERLIHFIFDHQRIARAKTRDDEGRKRRLR